MPNSWWTTLCSPFLTVLVQISLSSLSFPQFLQPEDPQHHSVCVFCSSQRGHITNRILTTHSHKNTRGQNTRRQMFRFSSPMHPSELPTESLLYEWLMLRAVYCTQMNCIVGFIRLALGMVTLLSMPVLFWKRITPF